jgi:hypothetical protein
MAIPFLRLDEGRSRDPLACTGWCSPDPATPFWEHVWGGIAAPHKPIVGTTETDVKEFLVHRTISPSADRRMIPKHRQISTL